MHFTSLSEFLCLEFTWNISSGRMNPKNAKARADVGTSYSNDLFDETGISEIWNIQFYFMFTDNR